MMPCGQGIQRFFLYRHIEESKWDVPLVRRNNAAMVSGTAYHTAIFLILIVFNIDVNQSFCYTRKIIIIYAIFFILVLYTSFCFAYTSDSAEDVPGGFGTKNVPEAHSRAERGCESSIFHARARAHPAGGFLCHRTKFPVT